MKTLKAITMKNVTNKNNSLKEKSRNKFLSVRDVFLISLIFLLFMVSSCMLSTGKLSKEDQEIQDYLSEPAPLNEKEQQFVNTFNVYGFKAELSRFYIYRNYEELSLSRDEIKDETYFVQMTNDTLIAWDGNYQQLNKLEEDVVTTLFTKIIADSVIYYIDCLTFKYNTQSPDIDGNNRFLSKNSLWNSYKKYDKVLLEKASGFKVIKTGKNSYKRISIP
jgi:hypothetical protein